MLTLIDKAVALQGTPLFHRLPAEALLPVAAWMFEVELDEGDPLFHEGESGDALYVVVRGRVIVERQGTPLATLGTGECVGELAVLDWEPRSATVTAAAPTLLLRLERHDLLDLLYDHATLADDLARVLVERIRQSTRHA